MNVTKAQNAKLKAILARRRVLNDFIAKAVQELADLDAQIDHVLDGG